MESQAAAMLHYEEIFLNFVCGSGCGKESADGTPPVLNNYDSGYVPTESNYNFKHICPNFAVLAAPKSWMPPLFARNAVAR